MSENAEWRNGRRIVELATLADNLQACRYCAQPLHLSDCVGENRFGLAQILKVKCRNINCGVTNDVTVATGSKHVTDQGGKAWDVNSRLAAGMINGGFGESHVNSLLAVLNIPGISKRGLKEREREIGSTLDKMAEDSCREYLQEEAKLIDMILTASFDGAWQKRGTGHAYNSLTGHASLIGVKTKKCIGYSVKSKRCRICSSAQKKNCVPKNMHVY